MSETRTTLPNRRSCESFNFELDGLRFTSSIGRFVDGRVAELFLTNHKSGNQSDTNARDAAIILSFALQHGANIDAMRAPTVLVTPKQGRPARNADDGNRKYREHQGSTGTAEQA